MNMFREFYKGILHENPLFCLMLGMCPSLAVTTSVKNGFGMGLSTAAVLLASNITISALRKVVPDAIRIPSYIVIVATFVTIIEMLMQAYQPELYKSLGIYIPLIVVNCIILGRAEAFANKNPILLSIMDALGMGLGFTLALVTLGIIRELIGAGTVLGFSIFGAGFQPALIMILPPGAFLTLGCFLAFLNRIKQEQ